MIHSTRLALAAAALAGTIVLAGCQHDSATAPSAGSGPRPAPAASPPAPGGPIALGDAEIGRTWTDAEGHVYSVLFGTGGAPTVSHYRDGSLFAISREEAGGATVSFYADGLLVEDQFIQGAGPAGLRAMADDASVPADGRDALARPFLQMQPDCGGQLGGYMIASTEMIAAAWLMNRNPSRRYRVAFAAAVINFYAAWQALYDCNNGRGG